MGMSLAQPRFTADEWLILQGMITNQKAIAATQPTVPSPSPGAPAIQLSSLRFPQAGSHDAPAAAKSAVSAGRPDVRISFGSIGPPRKPFDHQTEIEATVGVVVLMAALTDAAVVVEAVMAPDGAVDVVIADNEETTLDVVDTREVDMIVADNEEAVPVTLEEDGRRMTTRTLLRQARRIKRSSVLPSLEGEPKSTKKILATDDKDPTMILDQLEHQTGNDEASRIWTWTSEHLERRK
ncbi:hypothetical protein RvY_07714 [Ramazzottius varieornatus]|uniref:Uncharacterized protein n=1 Tax=Ramazzottius varieornatus TaxID=947166 RepID=A0A1D1VBJ0_RAMVA|nr:hypothetical protein RvY_07714 [Ramazzottius varieornatus]